MSRWVRLWHGSFQQRTEDLSQAICYKGCVSGRKHWPGNRKAPLLGGSGHSSYRAVCMPRLSTVTCGKAETVCVRGAGAGRMLGYKRIGSRSWKCPKNAEKMGWVRSIQEPLTLTGTSVFPHLQLPPPSAPPNDSGCQELGWYWGRPQPRGGSWDLERSNKIGTGVVMCSSVGRGDSPTRPYAGDSLRAFCGTVGTLAG